MISNLHDSEFLENFHVQQNDEELKDESELMTDELVKKLHLMSIYQSDTISLVELGLQESISESVKFSFDQPSMLLDTQRVL